MQIVVLLCVCVSPAAETITVSSEYVSPKLHDLGRDEIAETVSLVRNCKPDRGSRFFLADM